MTDFPSMSAEAKLAKFYASFNLPDLSIREELSQKQILTLAELFAQWAMSPTMDMDNAILFLGKARAMQDLAELTDPDWIPPEPERLSLLAFLARGIEEHIK